ncbi:MAG: UDP-N-acetylmuramate dehydrogenase [Deltaproteobacteria bacterium]|nr:UDP-N-acetylmuramate dehydrogenase [Deltaproteobacteria bacterium]
MSGRDWKAKFHDLLPDAVQLDEPLASKVSFRIGGPADAFVKVRNLNALGRVLRFAHEEGVEVLVLGTGANVLIGDLGVRGIVVRLAGELAEIHVGRLSDGRGDIEIGAGALNATVVALLLNLGFVGLEFLATIPGTIGGALVMNAGAHGHEMKDFVVSVELVTSDGTRCVRDADTCGFGYRTSGFGAHDVIASCRLRMSAGDPDAARTALQAMRARRKATQPSMGFNAGSIFKNPPGDFAGRLIEAAGLKGRRQGGAEISPQHANFIVNTGEATAIDVLLLAEEAQRAVKAQFGIALDWEVRRLGSFAARAV